LLVSSKESAGGAGPARTLNGIIQGRGAELASSLGMPADRPTFLALAAMLGEHLALASRSASSIRRMVRQNHDDPAAARIAARALSAGLDPEGQAAGEVIEAIEGFSQATDGKDGGDEAQGYRENRTNAGNPEAGGTDDDPAALDALLGTLKEIAEKAVLDDGIALLAAPGPNGGGWVCVPFEVPYRGVDFTGVMRLWYHGGNVRAGRLVADIRIGGERRLLDVREESSGRVIRYHADDNTEREAFAEAFGAYGSVFTGDLESGDLMELAEGIKVDSDA
jgi:hypothetical protein